MQFISLCNVRPIATVNFTFSNTTTLNCDRQRQNIDAVHLISGPQHAGRGSVPVRESIGTGKHKKYFVISLLSNIRVLRFLFYFPGRISVT